MASRLLRRSSRNHSIDVHGPRAIEPRTRDIHTRRGSIRTHRPSGLRLRHALRILPQAGRRASGARGIAARWRASSRRRLLRHGGRAGPGPALRRHPPKTPARSPRRRHPRFSLRPCRRRHVESIVRQRRRESRARPRAPAGRPRMSLVQINNSAVEISDALRRELERAVEGEVRFDKLSRALYSTDASVYHIEPAGVLVPKTREDIVRALAICRKFHCPITMRGGGTSQAGQAIGEGLQIDTSKYLNRLLEVNIQERWARVEPGIVLDELNAQIASSKLRFAPDISTASRATIGGMIANNSAGARSVLYGKTIDHVISLTMLLSDGTIAEFSDDPAALAGNA